MLPKLTTLSISLADGQTRPIQVRDNDLARLIAKEVLTGQAYPLLNFIHGVRTVVDIGGNVGLSAIWFAGNYKESRVVVAEPSPEAFAIMTGNIRAWPSIEAYPVGLHARAAQVPIFHGQADNVTNSIARSPHNSGESTPVTIEDAEQFLRDRKVTDIDILKLDTEGCEVPILERLKPRLPGIRVIYLEYHSDSDRRWIDDLLSTTHIMHLGKVISPHRGEFCYVARGAYPSAEMRDSYEIRTPELPA